MAKTGSERPKNNRQTSLFLGFARLPVFTMASSVLVKCKSHAEFGWPPTGIYFAFCLDLLLGHMEDDGHIDVIGQRQETEKNMQVAG
jgi:hypothetical protein